MSIEQRGSIEQSITWSNDGKKARRNEIYFCTEGETLSQVISQSSFPVPGSKFPGMNELICNEVELKQERDGKTSKITASCFYREPKGASISIGGIPYGKAFDFRVSPIENKIPFLFSYDTVDSSGNPTNPVCNSAGEFLNLETTKITMLLRFSYYIRSFEPEWILSLTDTINKSSVRVCGIGISEGCGLLRSISAEGTTVGGTDVIQVNIELEIDPSGFRRSVPDKGYYCMDEGIFSRVCSTISKYSENVYYASFEKIIENRKDDCPVLPVEDPVWLNGSGQVYGIQGKISNPIFVTFQEKRSADWGVLSLPSGNPW